MRIKLFQHAFGKEIVYNENKIQMTRKTLLGVFQGLYLLNIPFYTYNYRCFLVVVFFYE